MVLAFSCKPKFRQLWPAIVALKRIVRGGEKVSGVQRSFSDKRGGKKVFGKQQDARTSLCCTNEFKTRDQKVL